MNVNDMKMQTFILHGLTGYAIHAMHDVSTYVGIVFLLKDILCKTITISICMLFIDKPNWYNVSSNT